MLKKILSHLGRYKRPAILSPISMIGEVAMEVTIPFVMAKIIDVGINDGGGVAYILKMGLLMAGMACLSLLFGAGCARLASVASVGLAANLRSAVFDRVQSFSFKNTDKFSTGSLVTRLTTDITNTQMAFQMSIRMLVRAPMTLVLATVMAVRLSPPLSLVFAVAVPALGGVIAFLTVKAFPVFQSMFKKYDKLNSRVQENLIGIRIVKAFVREEHEKEKFNETADDVMKTSIAAEKHIVTAIPLIQFTMYACMIAISWFGAKHIITGGLLTGQFMSFITYSTQILSSLMMVAVVFVMLVMSRASMTRVCEVLDEQPDITDENADPDLTVADGSIRFDNVSFSYAGLDGKKNLDGISLAVTPGECIGILGGTGSAKTTLVQLIPRLYDVTGGSVSVGGHDVREYPLNALRSAVAMVLQKNVLFSGTIADNLRWGDPDATDAQLEAACKNAQAHDFIMSFPDAYQTVLGQGGVNLSGGQKQRLCIARALLKKPKVIILDDSTSAVDTATDARIQTAFKSNLTDVTTLIIAQRVASLQSCDRIVVLNEGRIDAVGTHEQLLADSEIYREVYSSQQKGVA